LGCDLIPYAESFDPCSTDPDNCSVQSSASELQNQPECYLFAARVSVPECPNYPQTFYFSPDDVNSGCELSFPIPRGGPVTVTYNFIESCGSCNMNEPVGILTRESFIHTETYEVGTLTAGIGLVGGFEMSFNVSADFLCIN